MYETADAATGPLADTEVLLWSPDALRLTGWRKATADEFVRRMLDQDELFPCIFGVDAVRRATLRFAFVDDTESEIRDLAGALREFTRNARQLGNRTSLVVFFERQLPGGSVDDHRERFWTLLRQLHAVDSAPWPEEIPRDTTDPRWEFSFDGMPMFVVANTPAHRRRRSRNFSRLCITFQPRFVFDDIPAGSRTGDNARKIIRARIDEYDSVDVTPLLGSFGETGNLEWMQYFLDDDNSPTDARCPFVMNSSDDARVQIYTGGRLEVPTGIADLLPSQGSIELQRDEPSKAHAWHRHSVDEKLHVIGGELLLFWFERGQTCSRTARAGATIALPAETVHGSVAGPTGAVYVIAPDGGQSATTTFLAEDSWPSPIPEAEVTGTASQSGDAL